MWYFKDEFLFSLALKYDFLSWEGYLSHILDRNLTNSFKIKNNSKPL